MSDMGDEPDLEMARLDARRAARQEGQWPLMQTGPEADWETRQKTPDYIIEALQDWLNGRGHNASTPNRAERWEQVRQWVHGDEVDITEMPITTLTEAKEFIDRVVDQTKPRAAGDVKTYIFTFGFEDTDREGNSLAKCYVELPGTYLGTRDMMNSLFGKNWAFQYSSLVEATRNGKYTLTNKTADLVPQEMWQ
jgi:hypothetical protein